MSDLIPKLWLTPAIGELDGPQALLDRGDYFCQVGRHKEALRDYDAALALEPSFDDGVGWLKRGHVLYRLGRLASAAVSYREATTHPIGMRGPRAWLCLAATLERMGRLDAAISVLDEYLSMRPSVALKSEGRTLVERARLAFQAHRSDEAAGCYLRAAEYDATRAVEAGDHFLFAREDPATALGLYEHHPEAESDGLILARRAAVCLVLGDEASGRVLWAKAIHEEPSAEQFARLWACNAWGVSRAVVELAQADQTLPEAVFWRVQ